MGVCSLMCATAMPVSGQTLFTKLPFIQSNIGFNNQLSEDNQINALTYQYLYNGGGVAVGDVNNDGLCDVFFTGNMVQDRLYINTGNLQFSDITETAGIVEPEGWSTGVTMADVNADGWLDIYVCRSGPYSTNKRHNLLFINNRNSTFTESAAQFGLNDSSFSTQAAFFDSDLDGDLDMFLLNHAVTQLQGYNTGNMREKRDPYAGNKLYRNDNGYYHDISAEAGINGSPMTFGLGLVITDINNDLLPDIFVSNDYQEQDFLYLNLGNNQFKEQIEQSFGHTANFSMGCDAADINNDSFIDIMAVDMLPETLERQKKLKGGTRFDAYALATEYGFFYQHMHNVLQLNHGNNTFCEIAWSAGVAATDWSWAPLFADFNLDGYQDLYITNGYRRDYTDLDFLKYIYSDAEQKAYQQKQSLNTLSLVQQMPSLAISNYMFSGNADIKFEQVTNEWGLNTPSFSNGAAYADLDNDGDLDIIVNNIDDTAFVYRNNQMEFGDAHYVRVQLKSNSKNTFCFGARIVVKTDTQTFTRELNPTKGFQSSVEPIAHFGVGKSTTVTIQVIYPDGKTVELKQAQTDSSYLITYDPAAATYIKPSPAVSKTSKQASSFLPYTHKEEPFPDFKRDPLIMQTISDNGPKMAVADINQDGIEDVFFTGAKNQKAQLFLSGESGYFPYLKTPWDADSSYEDTDAAFFDADGDGDADLFVVSGSAEVADGSALLQDRLYVNAGDGTFTKAPEALPSVLHNKTCVLPLDYDQDGDLDVFIGGGTIQNAYPLSFGSFLYENRNGVFYDVTTDMDFQFNELGNVTDAQFADITGDGIAELIICGHWMPITIVQFRNNKADTFTLPYTSGWWNCISIVDINADGDLDIIAGNRGTNHPIQVDTLNQVTIYGYDFDHNGSIDPIVTKRDMNRSIFPIHALDDLHSQIPALKKELFYYSDYAKRTLGSIYPQLNLDSIPQANAELMYSTVFHNVDSLFFIAKPLPNEAQWFPMYATALKDIDRDGDMDLICGGNNFGVRPEYTRMDAGSGAILNNDGTGTFNVVDTLDIRGEIRDMKFVRFGKSVYLIAGLRNNAAQCFLLNN